MEIVNVTIRGNTYELPRPVRDYFSELINWSEAMRKDAQRQMVIQMQTSNYLRAATNTPDPNEKSWIAFCFYFPAYIAMAGVPTAQKLGSILTDYFPLAHLTFRDNTYCRIGDPLQKSFNICHKKLEPGNLHNYELELVSDPYALRQNICEALRHVGYDFGVENSDLLMP